MTVANQIYEQLGGNKFRVMTGIKLFVGDKNSCTLHLTKNKIKAKYLKITLIYDDTYTMVFSTSKKVLDPTIGIKVDTHVIIDTITNVYCSELQKIFTEKTGLLTHL